jgi:hypothetical protein
MRQAALLYYTLPAMMFCLATGSKEMEPDSHGLKLLKWQAKIHFFSLQFDFSQLFCHSNRRLTNTMVKANTVPGWRVSWPLVLPLTSWWPRKYRPVVCLCCICFGIAETEITEDMGVNVRLLMISFQPTSKDVFQVLIAASYLFWI